MMSQCEWCPLRGRIPGLCDHQVRDKPELCTYTNPAAAEYQAGLVWKVCGFNPFSIDPPDWLPPLPANLFGQAAPRTAPPPAHAPERARSARLERARMIATLVKECPDRGDELPESEQPECNCPLQRLRTCGAGRGEVPGRVDERDCHVCAGERVEDSRGLPDPRPPS